MSKKPRMTITARFLDEKGSIAQKGVSDPYPNPPAGRAAIGRLTFKGPSAKLESNPAELVAMIEASLPDAQFFLDTNIFTTEHLDESVWGALSKRRITIVPAVFNELNPWLKTPFCNQVVRDRVLASLNRQSGKSVTDDSEESADIRVLLDEDVEDFASHGWEYYLTLLGLRKAMGPAAKSILAKQLGRAPTQDELNAEAHQHFGERGALLARKGLSVEDPSNALTDEKLILAAVFTAILRGTETFVVTRDPDLLEQYYKVLCLMKEHYRSMLVAEKYASDSYVMEFYEVPAEEDGLFTGSSYLRYETTDVEFNPLGPHFHFVNIYCLLLGGDASDLKLTSCVFCAETEMSAALKMKAATGGLSTDKFDGRNCLIHTAALLPDRHRVVVSIGNERRVRFGPVRSLGLDDLTNVLTCNELSTSLRYESASRPFA